jgi:type VI secretion system protein ImpJ
MNLIRSSIFILAATAQVPKESFRANLPTQVKIGSVERIQDLVKGMVPGVKIEAVEAPRKIPFLAGLPISN